MPQASQELRDLFPDDLAALKALGLDLGSESERFLEAMCHIIPKPGITPTEFEAKACQYLADEWDWSYDLT